MPAEQPNQAAPEAPKKKRKVDTPKLYKWLEQKNVGVVPLLGYFGHLLTGSVGSVLKGTVGHATGELKEAARALGYETKGKSPSKVAGELGRAVNEKAIDWTLKPVMHVAKTPGRIWERTWGAIGSLFSAVTPKWLRERVSKLWGAGEGTKEENKKETGGPKAKPA